MQDVAVDWSTPGGIGTLTPGNGPMSVFSATTIGQTTVDATTDALGSDSSGLIDVVQLGCDWWDTSWQYRRQLTFDNSGQAQSLTSFPVLVTLDAPTFDYTKAKPDGSDLRFIDDDGATVLPHHVELWNPLGQSFIWVNVTQIDASSTADHMNMYYGNTAATGVETRGGTYDADYAGVWHLDETAGTHTDAASNIVCTWTPGLGDQDVVGAIAGANRFRDSSVDCGTDQVQDTIDSTITAWVRMPLTDDDDQQVVAVEHHVAPYSGKGMYISRIGGRIGKWIDSGFGRWTGEGPNSRTRGRIDEVRISGVARSDEWVRAQHLSSSDVFVTDEGETQPCP